MQPMEHVILTALCSKLRSNVGGLMAKLSVCESLVPAAVLRSAGNPFLVLKFVRYDRTQLVLREVFVQLTLLAILAATVK